MLLAGLLPDAETAVAVMGLSTQVSMLPWMCTYSLGTATATRIAQALGAGRAARAARIFRYECAHGECTYGNALNHQPDQGVARQ